MGCYYFPPLLICHVIGLTVLNRFFILMHSCTFSVNNRYETFILPSLFDEVRHFLKKNVVKIMHQRKLWTISTDLFAPSYIAIDHTNVVFFREIFLLYLQAPSLSIWHSLTLLLATHLV